MFRVGYVFIAFVTLALNIISEGNQCTKRQFQCGGRKRKCIPLAWKCDGGYDCRDRSDERNCECSSKQFACKNKKKCIAQRLRCDGTNNCGDNSDETGCPTLPPLLCTSRNFHCRASSKCIEQNSVCNGIRDCPYGDDENTKCGKNECKTNNGDCAQICTDKKIGYSCSCRDGYKRGNNKKACIEIDECKVFGTCSQICSNTDGSFTCSCHENYKLAYDERTCIAKGALPLLVVSQPKNIQMGNKEKGFDRIVSYRVYPSVVSVSGIAVNSVEGVVYWIDIGTQTISKKSLKDIKKPTAIILRGNLKNAEGISVDHIGRKIYWRNTGDNLIEVANLDGSRRLRLIQLGRQGVKPRGVAAPIAVCPQKRIMFWTNWQRRTIEGASMDGLNRKTIIRSNHLTSPSGLAIDHVVDRIFWVDAGANQKHVGSSRLDGSDIRIVVPSIQNPTLGISVFEDWVYWIDNRQNKVYKANKFTGAGKREIDGGFYYLRDMEIYHPAVQMKGPNPCGNNNGGCRRLCLLSSVKRRGYSCR